MFQDQNNLICSPTESEGGGFTPLESDGGGFTPLFDNGNDPVEFLPKPKRGPLNQVVKPQSESLKPLKINAKNMGPLFFFLLVY